MFVCFEVKSNKWATSTEAQWGECFDKRTLEYNPKYKTEQRLQIHDMLAYLKYLQLPNKIQDWLAYLNSYNYQTNIFLATLLQFILQETIVSWRIDLQIKYVILNFCHFIQLSIYQPYHAVSRSILTVNKQQYFPKTKWIMHPKEPG